MKTIDDELAEIAARDGTLKPEAVVAFAQDPNTALHSQFEWDDTKAGHQFRLEQARKVIRVRVRVLPQSNEPVRCYVSLPSDRREGQGYRTLVSVMSDEDRRQELLNMALAEAQQFKRKYEHLSELGDVFSAIDQAQELFESQNAIHA